jgi:hypothetical protein
MRGTISAFSKFFQLYNFLKVTVTFMSFTNFCQACELCLFPMQQPGRAVPSQHAVEQSIQLDAGRRDLSAVCCLQYVWGSRRHRVWAPTYSGAEIPAIEDHTGKSVYTLVMIAKTRESDGRLCTRAPISSSNGERLCENVLKTMSCT